MYGIYALAYGMYVWGTHTRSMLTGENWNDIMEGAMLRESCMLVLRTSTATMANGTEVTAAGGAYLDPADDSALLDALPGDAVVSEDVCVRVCVTVCVCDCVCVCVCGEPVHGYRTAASRMPCTYVPV